MTRSAQRVVWMLILFTALSSRPGDAQNANTVVGFNPRQAGRMLDSAGFALGWTYTFESLTGTHRSVHTPISAGLTDMEIRWRPQVRGPLHAAEFTVIYSVYAQTRGSELPDLQGTSGLTAKSFRRWREAYFQTPVLGKARIKVGKVDANTEFAVVEGGADLSNASASVSPTLFTMPTYPDGALSANLFADAGRITLGGGVYRSLGGGLYYIGEVESRWIGRRPGRVAGGYWNQRAGHSAAGALPPSTGAYVIVEQTALSRGEGRALHTFARISTADESVAPASLHNMLGLSWTGFGRRREDSAGFALLYLQPTLHGTALRAERAHEVYYQLPLTRFLKMKLDLQHVLHPSGHNAPAFAIASVRLVFHVSTADEGSHN